MANTWRARVTVLLTAATVAGGCGEDVGNDENTESGAAALFGWGSKSPKISMFGQGCEHNECMWVGGENLGTHCMAYVKPQFGEIQFAENPNCTNGAVTFVIPLSIMHAGETAKVGIQNMDTGKWVESSMTIPLVP